MKTKLLFLALITIIATLLFAVARLVAKVPEQLAVAETYGNLQAFLTSSNYQSAYDLMTSEFQKDFTPGDMGIFARTICAYKLGSNSSVTIAGNHARLNVKHSRRFGVSFIFEREEGQWRYTSKTIVFESW